MASWSLVLATIFSILLVHFSRPISATTFSSYYINAKKPVSSTNERFLSFTLEPEILKHVVDCNEIKASSNLIRALLPAYLRIASPDADKILFQINDGMKEQLEDTSNTPNKKPENLHFTLTGSQWLKFANFVNDTGLRMVVSINGGLFDSDTNSMTNLLEFIGYSNKNNIDLDWQLGYELQRTVSQDAKALGRDISTLRKIIEAFPLYQKSLILGPDVSNLDSRADIVFIQNYLSEAGNSLDVFSLHSDFSNLNEDDDVYEKLLPIFTNMDNHLWSKEGVLKVGSRGVIPKKAVWIAEAENKDSTCTFSSTLSFVQRLGATAKLGTSVYLRKPHLLSLYGPTSEYWAAVFYKALVGKTVLDVKLINGNDTQVFVFSHCTPVTVESEENLINPNITYKRGAVTFYGINAGFEPSRISVKLNPKFERIVHIYLLTEEKGIPIPKTLLNKQELHLSPDNELPTVYPKIREYIKDVIIPARSIFFLVLPDAECRACHFQNVNENPRGTSKKTKLFVPDADDALIADDDTTVHNFAEISEDDQTDDKAIYVSYSKRHELSHITPSPENVDLKSIFSKADDSRINTKYITYSEDTWLSSLPDQLKEIFYKTQSRNNNEYGLPPLYFAPYPAPSSLPVFTSFHPLSKKVRVVTSKRRNTTHITSEPTASEIPTKSSLFLETDQRPRTRRNTNEEQNANSSSASDNTPTHPSLSSDPTFTPQILENLLESNVSAALILDSTDENDHDEVIRASRGINADTAAQDNKNSFAMRHSLNSGHPLIHSPGKFKKAKTAWQTAKSSEKSTPSVALDNGMHSLSTLSTNTDSNTIVSSVVSENTSIMKDEAKSPTNSMTLDPESEIKSQSIPAAIKSDNDETANFETISTLTTVGNESPKPATAFVESTSTKNFDSTPSRARNEASSEKEDHHIDSDPAILMKSNEAAHEVKHGLRDKHLLHNLEVAETVESNTKHRLASKIATRAPLHTPEAAKTVKSSTKHTRAPHESRLHISHTPLAKSTSTIRPTTKPNHSLNSRPKIRTRTTKNTIETTEAPKFKPRVIKSKHVTDSNSKIETQDTKSFPELIETTNTKLKEIIENQRARLDALRERIRSKALQVKEKHESSAVNSGNRNKRSVTLHREMSSGLKSNPEEIISTFQRHTSDRKSTIASTRGHFHKTGTTIFRKPSHNRATLTPIRTDGRPARPKRDVAEDIVTHKLIPDHAKLWRSEWRNMNSDGDDKINNGIHNSRNADFNHEHHHLGKGLQELKARLDSNQSTKRHDNVRNHTARGPSHAITPVTRKAGFRSTINPKHKFSSAKIATTHHHNDHHHNTNDHTMKTRAVRSLSNNDFEFIISGSSEDFDDSNNIDAHFNEINASTIINSNFHLLGKNDSYLKTADNSINKEMSNETPKLRSGTEKIAKNSDETQCNGGGFFVTLWCTCRAMCTRIFRVLNIQNGI